MSSEEWKENNKEKVKAYKRKWYRKNKDKQIQRQLERRKELKEWLWNYKRTLSCTDCDMPFKEHPECCDFHHKDSEEKERSVLEAILSSKKKALEEIEKCVPLCANCHRIRHKDMYIHLYE